MVLAPTAARTTTLTCDRRAMTPHEALAARIKETHRQHNVFVSSHPCTFDCMAVSCATEALRWAKEQLPGREEIARVWYTTKYPKQADYFDRTNARSREEYFKCADALLALLRERLGG